MRPETLRLPGWPPALQGTRVAVIADLHTGSGHVDEKRVARVVAAVNRRAPDLVVLLGDYVTPEAPEQSPERVAALLGELRAPLGVFAVLGNHDWARDGERVASALRGAGIAVLENQSLCAGPLWVAGVADATTRRPDVGPALAHVPDGAPILLLSHDPRVFPEVPASVALTVSGHTHGGQVGIPGIRQPVIDVPERYASGPAEHEGRHLFVSRGVGTSRLPIRFLAPPEVPVLDLRAKG
jgi:uncharacterized protein